MLTPEDKKTLIEFAGPLFAMSKEIDGMYFTDSLPKNDGIADSGIARGIQEALERDFRLSQAPPRIDNTYVQPHPVQQAFHTVTQPIHPQIEAQSLSETQYEFVFNPSKQDITNTLLESQNKLIKELTNRVDEILSLLTNDKTESK